MKIFDNGGITCDRYTLITDDAIFGFDENPFHPQGFGQYCGDWKGGNTEHLGKRFQITNLPERARQYVNQILQEGNLGHKTEQTSGKCH